MSHFVWCHDEECRIPAFRCLLCRKDCYPDNAKGDENDNALSTLLKTGRFKERFTMKRKEQTVEAISHDVEPRDKEKTPVESSGAPKAQSLSQENELFYIEDGKLQQFSSEDYTPSTIFQVMELFVVDRKLVRPEDPDSIIYDGKKPSKKTIPVIVTKKGNHVVLSSWDELETNPEQLADATEVIGATPVKQVFVLKKK